MRVPINIVRKLKLEEPSIRPSPGLSNLTYTSSFVASCAKIVSEPLSFYCPFFQYYHCKFVINLFNECRRIMF
jgi:hypothetical protein